MGQGWTMPEIDRMDICYYIRLIGRVGSKEKGSKAAEETPEVYIDQLDIF